MDEIKIILLQMIFLNNICMHSEYIHGANPLLHFDMWDMIPSWDTQHMFEGVNME